MASLLSLWLPILLSAVLVFVVSSVIHMASPWHKNDYPLLPNQDAVMDALRPLNIPPGDYFLPRPTTRGEMKTPAFQEKFARGPVVIFTIVPPGPMSMMRNLVSWFIYSLVVSGLAATVAYHALPHGTDVSRVFHFVSFVSFIGYAVALWQMSIWYHRAWSTTIKASVDGVIYALITGAVFMWLWPK